MPPPPPTFMNIEMLSSLVVIVCSFFIYFRTKELYDLTSHEGIKYFRYAFLFFGFSFLVHFLRPLLRIFTDLSPFAVHAIVDFFIVYVGSMAVLCLLYSVLWKTLRIPQSFLFLNIVAALLAVLAFIGRNQLFILSLHIVLYGIAIVFGYYESHHKKGKHLPLYAIYSLLFLSWITNVAVPLVIRSSLSIASALNIISAAIFLVLLYKVLKATAQQ